MVEESMFPSLPDPSEYDRGGRQPLSFYRRFREVRMRQWKKHGALVYVTDKPRFVIPDCNWAPPMRLARALRQIRSNLVVIADPLTRNEGEPLDYGCHLYTQDVGQYGIPWVIHQKEFVGRPDYDVLDYLRENDKNNMPGDRERILRDCVLNRYEATRKAEEDRNKLDEDIMAEANEAIENILHKKRVSVCLSTKGDVIKKG